MDASSHVLKLCDFGSSKALVAGEVSVAYICSRYYRAPELIFGAQDYTIAIDVWSMGCVFAELVMCRPLFPGETGIDQLVEIIKVLGTPTREQVFAMNKSSTEFNFPQVQAQSWDKVSGCSLLSLPRPTGVAWRGVRGGARGAHARTVALPPLSLPEFSRAALQVPRLGVGHRPLRCHAHVRAAQTHHGCGRAAAPLF